MTTPATVFRCTMPSPVGPLLLCGTATAITAIFMATRKHPEGVPADTRPDDGPFREARRQLEAYFEGELREFTLELAPEGTLFRQKVWRALLDIPYGATESYGALVGYGGGLERKQWLLAHEQRHAVGAQQLLPGL